MNQIIASKKAGNANSTSMANSTCRASTVRMLHADDRPSAGSSTFV